MTRLLNTTEAAERLNLSKDKVRDLVREGKLPSVALTRKLLFTEEGLAAAVALQERTARPAAARLLPG